MPRIADPDNAENLGIKVCRLDGPQTEEAVPLSALSGLVVAASTKGDAVEVGGNFDAMLKDLFDRMNLLAAENQALRDEVQRYRQEINSLQIPVIHVENTHAKN